MFCFKAVFVAPALTKRLAVISWHNTRRASDIHYSAMWLFASCLVITEFLSWQEETIRVISLWLTWTSLSSWGRINDGRLQLKCDGTQWRTERELKGKLANGIGNQYPSHYLGTWCIPALLPLMRTARLPVVDWTDALAEFNGLVRFAERPNLVSARVPSHFNWPVPLLREIRDRI